MNRFVSGDLPESKLSFLPERLRHMAALMFSSPRRAAAWIGMMDPDGMFELAAKHQPSPQDVERLKALFVEQFPDHDLENGEHRMLSGTPMMYPVKEVCTHLYG
ncbi:hypothetical protein G6L37_07350 [Agrobacterium rubi]|nr:hypothetical protein [Agrobacterium rubi]NTF25183.1 hypothetical protein [Agrobacterium rubi]